MPSKQTPAQQRKVAKVMHEFKEGELKGGAGKHPKVKSRKQAIAIALSEAGASYRQTGRKKPARAAAGRKAPARKSAGRGLESR